MLTEHVTCDRCGKDSIVKSAGGFFRLDNLKRRLEVVQIIHCPNCGLTQQPEKPATINLDPRGTLSGGGTTYA